MKRIFKKMNIYRRVLLLVLSCGALAFILPTALSLYTLNSVERSLSVQGNILSESVSEFVWEIAQRRSKEHLTEVAETRARHIDRELSFNGEDVVILSKMATKIMSSPENYLPRKLPNLRTETNVPYGAPYVYESANLVASGISLELKNEIEIASNITDALETMSFYYRDYQTSLYIGSKKGYFICVDLFPGKKGEGSVFPTEELRADFLNTFDPRERPWYKLAEQKQTLAFTDTFTGTDGLPDMACVMPYYDKEGFAGVVVQEPLGGKGPVGRGWEVFTLHAVVLEPGLDVQVPEQGAESGLDVGSALQHAQDARAVVTTEDVRDDGVFFRIGNVVEADRERRADGHGKAVRDMAFHGERRPDGVDDAVLRVAEAHARQG